MGSNPIPESPQGPQVRLADRTLSFGSVTQRLECYPVTVEVAGSNPVGVALELNRAVEPKGEALACQARDSGVATRHGRK